MRLLFSCLLLLSLGACAQDTLKIRKVRDYYSDCYWQLSVNNNYYSDTIPKSFFTSDSKIELRMFKNCEAGKRNDIFVSSFQIEGKINDQDVMAMAPSSFITEEQKKIIVKLNAGMKFSITNINVHGPDGFRKAQDLEFYLK
jgi:hypothetical protein